LLEAGDIKVSHTLLLTFLAQRQTAAQFKAGCLKLGESDPDKHHRKYGGERAKRPILFDGAMKRFLVRDGFSHVSGRSGLLAPSEGVAEPIGKAKSQIGLAERAPAL
jgi:hypothetical protein